MKTYPSTAEVLAQVKQALAARYSTGVRLKPCPQIQHARWGPLGGVLELLRASHDFTQVKLSLDLDAEKVVDISVAAEGKQDAEMHSEFAVPVTVAGRRAGELRVLDEHENAVSAPERVLLKRAARQLALFLSGEGRYLLRRARQRNLVREVKRRVAAG